MLSRFQFLSITLLLFLLLFPQNALATNCRKLFDQKKYTTAAKCFERKAHALGPSLKLGQLKRKDKGAMLRNAVICLEKAALTASSFKAAYFFEKAYYLSRRYRREKLQGSPERLASMRQRERRLKTKVKYGKIKISVNHPNAKSCISGFRYRRCLRASEFSIWLRIGHYKFSVTYPGKPVVTKRASLKLSLGSKKSIQFSPPPQNKPTPPKQREPTNNSVIKTLKVAVKVSTYHIKSRITIHGEKLSGEKSHTGDTWSLKLLAGVYKLTVYYPGFQPLRREFLLKKGHPISLAFIYPGDQFRQPLAPQGPPKLNLQTSPLGVRIYLDGKFIGKTPKNIKVSVGQRVIEYRKGCYLPFRKTVLAEKGKELAVSQNLIRDPAYLSWEKAQKAESGKKALGWVLLGGGILTMALGGGALVLSGSDAKEAKKYPSGDPRRTDLSQSSTTYFYAGAGLLSGGGLLGVLGAIRIATASSSSIEEVPCKEKIVQRIIQE